LLPGKHDETDHLGILARFLPGDFCGEFPGLHPNPKKVTNEDRKVTTRITPLIAPEK